MISVIICSVNKSSLKKIRANIEDTIGISHEIIAINNSNSLRGICDVYNEAGKMAKYPVLCFVHEDVFFQTPKWGLLVLQHFLDPKVGLIGMAGGDTKSIVPSSWSIVSRSKEVNLVQYSKGSKAGKRIMITENFRNSASKKVVMLDGFFLCTKREVFRKYKFDSSNFKGFHGYDIDYSLQVYHEYDVKVIFDVLVHHYSTGTPNKSWVNSALTVSRKWKQQLPVSVYPLTGEEFNFHHWKCLQVFLYHLFRLNYPFYLVIYYYLYYSFTKYFRLRRFLSMGKYVLQNFIKKPADISDKHTEQNSISQLKVFNYN